jgi:hypothetical protein
VARSMAPTMKFSCMHRAPWESEGQNGVRVQDGVPASHRAAALIAINEIDGSRNQMPRMHVDHSVMYILRSIRSIGLSITTVMAQVPIYAGLL